MHQFRLRLWSVKSHLKGLESLAQDASLEPKVCKSIDLKFTLKSP